MDFFKKLFRSERNSQTSPVPQTQSTKINETKASFFTWICTSKQKQSSQSQMSMKGSRIQRKLTSTIRTTVKSSGNQQQRSKISNRASLENDYFHQEQVTSEVITILQKWYSKLSDLIDNDKMYGVIFGSNKNLFYDDSEDGECFRSCIWIKIGYNQELNSLLHLRPYSFDEIFMVENQFGYEYTMQEMVRCKQQITVRVSKKRQLQSFINTYEQQLMKNYGYKLLGDCLNRLHVHILHLGPNEIWLKLNARSDKELILDQLLEKIGFDRLHSEYQSLKQDVAKCITLEEYISIIKNKQKLQLQYQEQSVEEFIKNKLLQKLGSSRKRALSPLKKMASNEDSCNQEYYEYFMSINSKQNLAMSPEKTYGELSMQSPPAQQQQGDNDEEIFNLKVYKDDRQQQAKRVATIKQRKQRSRSADVALTDIGITDTDEEYFDEKQ